MISYLDRSIVKVRCIRRARMIHSRDSETDKIQIFVVLIVYSTPEFVQFELLIETSIVGHHICNSRVSFVNSSLHDDSISRRDVSKGDDSQPFSRNMSHRPVDVFFATVDSTPVPVPLSFLLRRPIRNLAFLRTIGSFDTLSTIQDRFSAYLLQTQGTVPYRWRFCRIRTTTHPETEVPTQLMIR